MKNIAQKTAMILLLTVSISSLIGCDDGGGSGKKKKNNNVYYPGSGQPGSSMPVFTGNVTIERGNLEDYELFLEKTLQICNYRRSWNQPACSEISAGGRLDLILDNPNNPWSATFTYTAFSNSNSRHYNNPAALFFDFASAGMTYTWTELNRNLIRDDYYPTPYIYIKRKNHEFDLVLSAPNRDRLSVTLYLDGRVIARANLQSINMVPFYQQYNSYTSQGNYSFNASGSRTYSY